MLGRWGRWSILRIQPWSVHCCTAARARASSTSGTSRGGGMDRHAVRGRNTAGGCGAEGEVQSRHHRP
eukprot:scaffold1486_cov79-Isochrysis_galbana.AAC.1